MPRPVESFDIGSELEHAGMKASAQHGPGVFVYEDWDIEELSHPKLGNPDLPIAAYKDDIVTSVQDNPVTVIVAETGAGKSTQVPQMLADAGYCQVDITQPRRAAARNVFSRIRDEISEVRGAFAGEDMVSYQTAAEHDGPEDAIIRVVTDGLLLVRELSRRKSLDNVVVVLDEVHEWNANTELLVAYLKKAIPENPGFRLVVMSATMDAENVADYYTDVCPSRPSIINVPGRSYKVEKQEKPESAVVEEVLAIVDKLVKPGEELDAGPHGILVFEPGKREIQDAIAEIKRRLPKEAQSRVKLFPLHAKLSVTQQQAAITEYPDCVKIVVATDVAQTSLTIPDIKYVVDSGYQRRIEVDEEATRGLVLNPISRADIEQRAGRTGRVSDGYYILTKLNGTTSHVPMHERDEYPMPEILRTDIARNTLRLKALGIEIADFDMFHRAARHVMDVAKVNLVLLDALDDSCELTQIGAKMNEYPLCTSSARIMVESTRYKRSTRDYLAAIVSSKEIGGLQYFAHNVGKRWMELTDETESDLLVQLDLFMAAQDMTPAEIKYYDLDINNVERAQEQYAQVAKRAGAEGGKLEPPTAEEREDILKCLRVGFVPSVYVRVDDKFYVHAYNKDMKKPREISNRSRVTESPQYIVGDPYNVELLDSGESSQRNFIENVSAITLLELGAAAASRVVMRPESHIVRDGKIYEKQIPNVFGIDIGASQEVVPTPSPKVRHEIIEYAKQHAGAEQKRLRAIKEELEELARIAKDPVPLLTHNHIMDIIEAAAPADIMTPATIEDNLRTILNDPSRGISIDDFVSPERRADIRQNAPASVEIEGLVLHVEYSNRKPFVKVLRLEEIINLSQDEVTLADGREIVFRYKHKDGHTKKYTLTQLKDRFSSVR